MEGFGITLESKSLSWSQTLELDTYSDFLDLKKEFITTFSNMGIKHNVVAQICSFAQKENE